MKKIKPIVAFSFVILSKDPTYTGKLIDKPPVISEVRSAI
jgi:hypothetical protein